MPNPTFPQLNDSNAIQYFQSIESNASAYQSLYSDMDNDFLGAIELRFNVTNSQRTYITAFSKHQKQTIQCAIKTLADYLEEDAYSGKKVVPELQGFVENPPQPANKINVKGGAKVDHDINTGTTKGTLWIEISCLIIWSYLIYHLVTPFEI